MEVVVLVLMLTAAVSAFPSGPAEGSCYNMYPQHGAAAQTSAAPYTITVNKATYSPGEVLEVTLSGTGGATFNGYMLQARRADADQDQDEPLGSFTNPSDGTKVMCDSNFASGHNSPVAKSSITATWVAPDTDEGQIRFRATVIGNNAQTFWLDVYSDPIEYSDYSARRAQQILRRLMLDLYDRLN